MAILTGHARLVRAAVCRNISGGGRMAFDTVSAGQHRPVGRKRTYRQRNSQQG